MSGLLVASPMSGSGKTTFTLGLLRALRNKGVALAPGKAGPDYIDPAFHAAASGETCLNFDPWGMRRELLRANAGVALSRQRLLVIEAMMGLYDGAADGTGSAAELAVGLNLPVLFVVNCQKMSHSIAALVRGFSDHDPNVMIAGVVLNNVASPRHEAMLRVALDNIGIRVVCVLYRDGGLEVPERHLGLVQAGEHQALEQFIERAASLVEQSCNLDELLAMASSLGDVETVSNIDRLPPPGQRVAVARDLAFAFCYEHMLLGWRRRGADIRFFSPVANEAPPEDADAVYLPGGYPELHAGQLSQAAVFKAGIKEAASRNAPVYGECGGYMVLGEGLIDAAGCRHPMAGLLPLTTSFEQRKLHLGYRHLAPPSDFFWPMALTAHEFHYATIVEEGRAERLFDVADAQGHALASAGLRSGSVSGSFMHVIDRAASL
ncbi:MAG: cobyrinate a,c-diamide synthase [Alphaproteobacteria bacterium]|nr:cobyrinate a,c-diamide synthase [Alphaproteobacteria bacterium]